ncbi:ankyrin repeat domain-containing protein 44 [Coprinopsis cinerea okayama7|uniref:Ankyrin repeat domain-containing protein 44 n=1 Tax=Coprinopsis cinerea (strain Okayama-7 / 130 / ATCC MYA-4618 / FGSC 9003) TaxID=240176 RepID=A8N4H2_COPC7|nr:ankyrin repeat domain-containing protein 44 [Coprinopsis cinerea okayama7\|eukprot:XP_001829840.2 ankyrin repeat domain-containing protein 44 [Coprinopsis cinerea okayama7\
MARAVTSEDDVNLDGKVWDPCFRRGEPREHGCLIINDNALGVAHVPSRFVSTGEKSLLGQLRAEESARDLQRQSWSAVKSRGSTGISTAYVLYIKAQGRQAARSLLYFPPASGAVSTYLRMAVEPRNPAPVVEALPTTINLQADSQVHSGGIVTSGPVTQNIINNNYPPAPPPPAKDDENAKLVAEIMDWLKAKVNFRAIHSDVKKKRAKGTGDWFINSDEYREWKTGEGSVLCATGIPGAGKTTLMSRVIDDLLLDESSNPNICVLFIYNRYDDLLSTAEILKGLVLQATQKQNRQFLDAVKSIQSRRKLQGIDPTEEDLIGLLLQLEVIFDRVYYVFDGADELVQPQVQSTTLVELISAINQLKGNAIVASRPLQVLQKLERANQVDLKAESDDMRTLINNKIDWSPNLSEVLEETGKREEIVADIIEKANHMFLHAALQVEALVNCHTPADVEEELKNFPRNITDMYKTTLHRIKAQDPRSVRIATTALLWLVHAKAPLRVQDLQSALSAHPVTHSVETSRKPPLKSILSVCCGLVEHHPETDVVRLVHLTAREALEPLLLEEQPHPHAAITKVLLQLMIDNNIPNCPLEHGHEMQELLQTPLLRYAYEHWGDHAREPRDQAGAREVVASFLHRCVSFPYGNVDWLQFGFDILQPLHVAAAYGFRWFIEDILASHDQPLPHDRPRTGQLSHPEMDVNMRSAKGETALHLALDNGHGVCAKALLRFRDIDINAVNGEGRTALMKAAGGGHKDVVERLLRVPGIEVNAVDRWGRTALMKAVVGGHKDVVERLLQEPGINVNTVDGEGRTALMDAAGRGHKDIVERLLREPGIEVNAVDGEGRTALMKAVVGGHKDIVERLLRVPGIEVNTVDRQGRTVLMWAAAGGHNDIVERLLQEPGIEVNAVDEEGRTALMIAAWWGHEDVVERLLRVPGIDVKAVDRRGNTALMMAAGGGHKDVVECLLREPGIDVNAMDVEGRTALMEAAMQNHEDIVELLLRVPGINVNTVDGEGRTALMMAAGRGHKAIVARLLRVPGIEVNTVDGLGRTALMIAAGGGHEDIVERLLREPLCLGSTSTRWIGGEGRR